MASLNAGTRSKGQSVAQTERDTEPESIRPTTTYSLETMNVLTEVSKSVGYITGKKESGTCWRVGNDKIITAAHVVKNNIWNTVLDIPFEEDLKTFKVDFGFISEKSSSFFKVEPKVLFMDESLDVAVLQLKPNDQKQFPPPLETFDKLNPEKDEHKHVFLISHNKGEKKEVNFGIGIWNPTEKRLEDLEKFCRKYGKENGYKDVDRKDRLVIQCEFVGGASGSPGIVIYNNVAHVVFVYIRGFPSFYYSQRFPDEERRKFPSDKLLQQGVNIGDLFNTMSKNEVNLKLRNEIFPVEAKKQHQHKQSSQNIEHGGSDKFTVQDLCAGMENTRLESNINEDTVPMSSLSIETLPLPAKRTIPKRPSSNTSKETNLKAAAPTASGQHSFEPKRSTSEQTCPKTTTAASGENSFESSLTSSSNRSINNSESVSLLDSSMDSFSNIPASGARGGCMMTQTVMHRDNQSSKLQQKYVSQVQTGPNTQTISTGNINIETTAPVNLHQQTEIDQRLKPALENLKKIINVFVEPNMDLKPKDVAQKSGIGKTAKDVNKSLYLLDKKKVLTLEKNADGTDPRWNRGTLTQYSEKELLEWAAEIVHASTTTTVAPTQVHHHHNHQHEHNAFFQVGNDNVIALDRNNQKGRREREVMTASEDIVSNLQQNSQ
ncbi:uncharacterized protein LOC127711718 isoform X1 [Mytilus californianus]|uniref:uncharacterized protein LOC127711718 isoform X1 n=1 Tax=Mytilus californianus TaxID=6549 RepID=UPI0022457D1D|nr:uncharacterized protein LOC127711718 isoform X1 [Mytilus californianus]